MDIELIHIDKNELSNRLGQPILVKGIYPDQEYRWGVISDYGIQHADGMLESVAYEECSFYAFKAYEEYMDFWKIKK